MKTKIFITFLTLAFTSILFFSKHSNAQIPHTLNYQAVAYNSNGHLLVNQGIGMRVSIIQGSVDGYVVYSEIQKPTTNINGLVTVEIGDGEVLNGDFSSIDWSSGPYFIKTEIDPTGLGNTNYTLTAINQLLSVPFALHAKTAESVLGEITETDPVFSAWDKSTGITITESQIIDLGNYIDEETDPLFTNWDKSTGVTITEAQISDLGNYIDEETDPIFTAWDKSAGISISINQITDFGDYIEVETDPVFTASAAYNITNAGSGAVITDEERTKLHEIEAGAQVNVKSDWNATEGDAEILNKPTKLSQFANDVDFIILSDEPSTGDILFYNGTNWTTFAKGNPGQVLTIGNDGEFVWGNLASAPEVVTLDAEVEIGGIATLNAMVNANGVSTTVTFEYGLTEEYGNTIAYELNPVMGNIAVEVNVTVTGLTIGETYHFRVKAENAIGDAYGEDNEFLALLIGDSYQGGKLAYIFQPGDNGYVEGELHGIIVSSSNLSNNIPWYNGEFVETEAISTALGDGRKNTDMIIDAQGDGTYAAKVCRDYDGGGFDDWFLPSRDELQKVYNNRNKIGGLSQSQTAAYWSSTEFDEDKARILYFVNGGWWNTTKDTNKLVRAIRIF